jgi:hypothetical protein
VRAPLACRIDRPPPASWQHRRCPESALTRSDRDPIRGEQLDAARIGGRPDVFGCNTDCKVRDAAGSDTIHDPAEEVAILGNARNRSGVLVQCPYPGEQILDDMERIRRP